MSSSLNEKKDGVVVSVATGVMSSLIEKLLALLGKEYAQSKGVQRKISFLRNELSGIYAMLRKYAVLEESDPQVMAWMTELRELSYDMEDCVDSFVHLVETEPDQPHGIYGFFRNCVSKVKQLGARREIAAHIDELESLVIEASERRARYCIGEASTVVPAAAAIDPRLPALFVEEWRLVGVDGQRDYLVRFLTEWAGYSFPRRKIVAVVGFAGSGKTTLANQVYKKIKVQFDCAAFVSVSQNPDMDKILTDIHSSSGGECTCTRSSSHDQAKLIDCIRRQLENKRYLIIVDDIWSTTAWTTIQCAFPDNNCASRVMATTRNATVANFCCSSHEDLVYKVKPLSSNDSKILFMKRIFGSDDRWTSHLENISDQILKKCGGLPLAIISIASMLANRPLTHVQWARTLDSIGHSLENDPALDDVKNILLLSYSDLPHHLKTCLLYLSIFPEDYLIQRDRLVWRWIAEGFIGEERGKSLVEIGQGYFNELINRSMILPCGTGFCGTAYSCQVHDVMLDLLVSLSTQDNFVTVLGNQSSLPLPSKVRRLSFQGHRHVELQPTLSLAHVRSLTCFSSDLMPSIAGFKILRVLDLEGCRSLTDSHLEIIGALFQLRYLRLQATQIRRLPKQIENLQNLQTLDLRETTVTELPPTVVQLKQLVRLLGTSMLLPDRVWDMSALQMLPWIDMCEYTPSFIRELGKMNQLRDICILWNPQCIACGEEVAYEEAFVYLLCELGKQNLRHLSIFNLRIGLISLDFLADSWCPHPHLLETFSTDGIVFSRLPGWLVSLANLSNLRICIREVKKEDLYLLGDLPSLLTLELRIQRTPEERFIIGSNKFQCLKFLSLESKCCEIGLFFEAGALPKVQRLELSFSPQKTLSLNGSFDLGIQNLSSLEYVAAYIYHWGQDPGVVNKLKAAIIGAAKPSVSVNFVLHTSRWRKARAILELIRCVWILFGRGRLLVTPP